MASLTLSAPGIYKLDLKAPHTIYKNAAGQRVCSVTTALGVLNKAALLDWAAWVERDWLLTTGLRHSESELRARNGKGELVIPLIHGVIRDTAADLGTTVHARVHAWLRGAELDPEGIEPEMYAKSIHGLNRFVEEWTKRGMRYLAGELPMVSESRQCGGTGDIIALNAQDMLEIWDLKTSKPNRNWPYDEVLAQASAYAAIWEELNPLQPIASVCAVRLGKEKADDLEFYPLSTVQRAAGLELFEAALKAYRAKTCLARVA